MAGKPLNSSEIAELLKEEQTKEDQRWIKPDVRRIHGFPAKMDYLFELPYEQMFVPWKSTFGNSEGYWHCLGCGVMVKNRESHFNWHKKDLT